MRLLKVWAIIAEFVTKAMFGTNLARIVGTTRIGRK